MQNKTITCYRFVTEDLKSQHGEVQWVVGEWQKYNGKLELCVSGFHGCREPMHSLEYVYGDRWFLAEARGEIFEGRNKFCTSEMRLVKEVPIKVIHQWMVDAAYRVLHIYEEKYPEDMRPRKALEAKQAWIDNSCEETTVAARAATAATRAAAEAEAVADAATWAAWAAAGAAAGVVRAGAWAARAAGAAEAAEKKWQREHLEYLMREALGDE